MKIKKYLYLTFIIVLISCNNSKNKSIDDENTITIVRTYSVEEFDLCQPDSFLLPVIDSVATNVNSCEELKQKNLIYSMNIFEGQDSLMHIKFEGLEQRRIYCSSISRFFIYKGLLFRVYVNKKFDHLFINKGQKIKFECQQDNASRFGCNNYGEGYWCYIYDNRFKCVSYGFCDNQWRDDNYDNFYLSIDE